MAVLTLSPNPSPRSSWPILSKTLASGRLAFQGQLHPYERKNQLAAAADCGVELQVILDLIQRYQSGEQPATLEVPETAPLPTGAFKAVLRGLRQPAAEGQELTRPDPLLLLDEMLNVTTYPIAEPVMEWRDPRLVVLDVDYHDRPLEQRPAPHQLENLATRVEPAPPRYNVSHGLGLHLYYVAQGGYSGLDLAAAAAVWIKQADPTASVELKQRSRHPAYPRDDGRTAGPVRSLSPTADLAALRGWLQRTIDDQAVAAWLEDQGLVQGSAYEHRHCPICPGEPSHGKPLFVGQHGLFCHHCAAAGYRMGSRTPGLVPYVVLLNAGLSPLVRTLVENRTHWEHARVVIAEKYGLTGDIARHAYLALLKLVHHGDPALERVFQAGTNLIRLPRRWTTADGSTTYRPQYMLNILSDLPACQLPDGSINMARVDLFRQECDLTAEGYPGRDEPHPSAAALDHRRRQYRPGGWMPRASISRSFDACASEPVVQRSMKTSFKGSPEKILAPSNPCAR
jgi:hypothetical protein